jgi:hypothetical protein
MDQAWCGQRPLAGTRTDEQLTPQDEYERVPMHMVLLQGIALGQQAALSRDWRHRQTEGPAVDEPQHANDLAPRTAF